MNRLSRHSGKMLPFSETPLVSIMSGKGGVGKSVIAFNLAECLAERNCRTLLVDADQGRGNLHILANKASEYGLAEFASGQLSLDEAKLTIGSGFDLLVATNSEFIEDDEVGQRAARMISELRRQAVDYDIVIIDHPSGTNQATTVISHASNLNLLVLVPELTSIADAYGLYKELITAHRRIDCRLIANWVEDEDEAEYLQDKFCSLARRFLDQSPRFLGWLPLDPDIRKALAAQVPLRRANASCPALRALDDIAARLVQILSVSPDVSSDITSPRINDMAKTADM